MGAEVAAGKMFHISPLQSGGSNGYWGTLETYLGRHLRMYGY